MLIDFDSQGNATQGLNANQNNSQATIHSVLMEGVPIQQAIVPKMNPRIDIVPANINLAGADLDMDKMEAGKEELLKKPLHLFEINMITLLLIVHHHLDY